MKFWVWFDSIQITKSKTSENEFGLFCSEPLLRVDYGFIGTIVANLYAIYRLSTTSYHENTSQIMSREWRQTLKKILLTKYKLIGHAKSQILICGRAYSHYFIYTYIHPSVSITTLFCHTRLCLRFCLYWDWKSYTCVYTIHKGQSRNRNTWE